MSDEARGFDGGEHRCAGRYRAVSTAVPFLLACSLAAGAQLASAARLDAGRALIATPFQPLVAGPRCGRSGRNSRPLNRSGRRSRGGDARRHAARSLSAHKAIVQIGVFSLPATLEDVAALTLDSSVGCRAAAPRLRTPAARGCHGPIQARGQRDKGTG